MGTVYKAGRDGRIVALKVLAEKWTCDDVLTNRFLQEGLIMARLSHPALVKVLEAGFDQEKHYLVLEYVEGPSFAKAIARRAFTPRETAIVLSAVAHGLHHAHRQGVVHGDVVPGNILLKSDGSPKLTDFGIARLRGPYAVQWKRGVTAGTPVYMSPEQAAAMNDVIDGRSDVYSLGAVLYEAVTGRAPFSGRSTMEILNKVARVTPPAPSLVDPSIDGKLEEIIVKAMDKDPARRYASAEGFADALRDWSASSTDLFSGLSS